MSDGVWRVRREAGGILGIWAFFALWVIGHAAWRAYPEDPSQIRLVAGFPAWVVWGIALPWAVATVVTVGFCLWVMRDEREGGSADDA
jgi:hypothetical protein